MDTATKIAGIRDWIYEEAPESFDDSFFQDIAEKYEGFGYLTEKQEKALDNIINRFKVDRSYFE